ncbi:recombinase family protein [Bradyrhizobium sp.]|uniref:recombinase family protein n=1 Tax=Bradyrhizobium sp. TaxID=376 RepID=UPI001D55EB94|nr:recombinase family protein [Bradyrhizobium sp.]MBI5320779.1 recombinase family protein [Bradyrhizobium sp.]
MTKSLIVRRAELSKFGGQLSQRAAQYVRMSTIHQRYSIENQAAAIAAYAARYNLTIVRTYRDDGISGLRIDKRGGLKQLIADVCSGHADFSRVLVYDVSRWGRFQDVDESAHYEFLCRQAGISVEYCAEQFDNDGSLLSSIVKNLKRVMAAEFSRELSAKVHAGQCRVAGLGFRVGGPLTYALRRELVDENRVSKGALRRGQQKNLKADRVVLRLGPPEEAEMVRRIFREYVEERLSAEEIARRLNREGVPNHRRRPWTRLIVTYLLRNENYIGNTVYNRKSFRLRLQRVSNPPSEWVRSKGVIPAIVDRGTFLRAQRRSVLRWQHLTDDELLQRLRSLLEKQGRLSEAVINDTLGVPSIGVFCKRFGSLRNAYRLIGYQQKWNADWIDRKDAFNSIVNNTAADLIARLGKAGTAARYEAGTDTLMANNVAMSLRITRSWFSEGRRPIWTIYRRSVMLTGFILAIRLDEANEGVLDYFLLPTREMKKDKIRFMEAGLSRLEPYRCENLAAVARAVLHRTGRRQKRHER